jgi:hypothetical protein
MSGAQPRGILQVGCGASGPAHLEAWLRLGMGAGCGSPIPRDVERLVPKITAAVGRVSPDEQIVLPDEPSRTPHH